MRIYKIHYIPQDMCTFFILLCFVVAHFVYCGFMKHIYPYSLQWMRWCWGNCSPSVLEFIWMMWVKLVGFFSLQNIIKCKLWAYFLERTVLSSLHTTQSMSTEIYIVIFFAQRCSFHQLSWKMFVYEICDYINALFVCLPYQCEIPERARFHSHVVWASIH